MGSDADTSIIMKRYLSEKDACTSTKLKFLVKRVSKRQALASRHTQGQPAFVKQGSEAYLVVKSEAVKQEKERI